MNWTCRKCGGTRTNAYMKWACITGGQCEPDERGQPVAAAEVATQTRTAAQAKTLDDLIAAAEALQREIQRNGRPVKITHEEVELLDLAQPEVIIALCQVAKAAKETPSGQDPSPIYDSLRVLDIALAR